MGRELMVCAFVLAGCGRVNFGTQLDGGDPSVDTAVDGDAVTYRDAVIADGPLGYWRLGDTGNLATDEMAGPDGLYGLGCTMGVPGAIANDTDRAVMFDGVDCRIDLADRFAFTGSAPFTMEAWAAPAGAALGSPYQHIFTRQLRNGGPVDGYALVYANGLSAGEGLFAERVVSTSTVEAGRVPSVGFVHVVGVFDGASVKLYVNGTELFSKPDTNAMRVYAANAWIGAGPDPQNPPINFFKGALDEVALYGKALSPERIARHHSIGVQ